MKFTKKLSILICVLALICTPLTGCDLGGPSVDITTISVEKEGEYISMEEVAAYIYQYGELPDNYITKEELVKKGWIPKNTTVDEIAPGRIVGGGTYIDETVEQAEGRIYYECDVNYTEGARGAERLVYSNDGMIYYTPDHYETFELLYEPS